MSAGHASKSGNLPIPARLIVAKDVQVPVTGIDLEPALRRRNPAIDDSADLEPTRTQQERARLLFAAIAGVTLDANCHDLMVSLDLATRECDAVPRALRYGHPHRGTLDDA